MTDAAAIKLIDGFHFSTVERRYAEHATVCTQVFRAYWREHLAEFKALWAVEQSNVLYNLVNGDRATLYVEWDPQPE